MSICGCWHMVVNMGAKDAAVLCSFVGEDANESLWMVPVWSRFTE